MFGKTVGGETVKELLVVLDHFEESKECNNVKRFFGEGLINREQWGFILGGVSRTTIYRWEKGIIQASDRLSMLFYKNKSKKNDGLDGYQRFFLSLILLLKSGAITNEQMTYEQVTNYFLEKENGQARWLKYSRNKFNQWIGAN